MNNTQHLKCDLSHRSESQRLRRGKVLIGCQTYSKLELGIKQVVMFIFDPNDFGLSIV